MAFELPNLGDTFDVIVRIDSALEYEKKAYEEYIKTLDESLLRFKPGEEPTRLTMRKVLPQLVAQKIQNQQATVDKDGEFQMNMGFMMEEVRASIVGVKNPASQPIEKHIKWTQHFDGGASPELIAQLNAIGLIADLYNLRQTAMQAINGQKKK